MDSSDRSRLLVVDDNAEWRSIIAGILEPDHDLVGVVERGDQIIEAAGRLCPDVITLDVSMPGGSGLNALPLLRALCPQAIIIMVSVTSTPLYMQEAFARGANGYVDKGRVRSDLMKTVAAARDRKSSSTQGAVSETL